MTYTYRAKRQNLDALNLRRQIAAAEVEAAERELAEINNAEIELQHLGIRREQLHYELKQARGRANLTKRRVSLPPPVYGGREGLLAATKEAEGWDTRRKQHKQGAHQ